MSLPMLSQTISRAWRALVRASTAALLIVSFAPAFAAITFDPTPSSGGAGLTQMEIIQDSGNPALSGAYLGVRFSSSTALTNVYARAVVGGAGYSLDATEAQDHFIGDLSGTAKTSYWFINYPTTGNGTLQIQIYVGNPAAGGVLQGTSTTYTVSSANADSSASANKIVSVSLVPSSIQLGQKFNVVVCYGVNSTARLLVEPASSAGFDPNNLRLGNVSVDIYGSADCTGAATATLVDQLLFAGPVSSNSVRATYTFQSVGPASVSLSPIVSARSGIYKYNSDYATPPTGVSYTIPAPTNRVKLAKSVNITESSIGTTVTYTLTASNSGTADVILDDFVDTLPASPANATYVAGSSRLNGATVLSNPVISGQTLTWGNPDLSGASASSFKVLAGGSVALSFQATLPSTNGLYTNSAIAHINGYIIGSTETLGSAPATAATTIGPPSLVVTKTTSTPALVNAAGGTTATYTVTVTNGGTVAAGVKVIDTLPAGFTYASTTSVTLAGSALAPSAYQVVTTGAQTPSTPQWDTNPSGGFTLAGSKTLVITFVANVAATVADGTYDNSASTSSSTTGAVIANFNGAASSTENVTVTSAVLAVAKSTSTPSVTNAGSGTSASYTIVVTNSGTAAATGVKVVDTLPAGFTHATTTGVKLNGSLTTAYTVTGTATPQWDTNPAGGFTINPGQTLEIAFTAAVAANVPAGTYDNSAAATGSARSIANFVGSASNAENVTVVVTVAPTAGKTFSPASIVVGGTSVLKISIVNPNAVALTGAAFTDNYPAGLQNTSGAAFSAASVTAGCTGTITGVVNGTSLALSGGTIPAGATCEVVVNVTSTSATATTHTNPSFGVSSSNAATGTAAAATLTVTASITAPSISKVFSPNPVNINFPTTLTITITNPNASPIAALAFDDPYPAGLVNTGTPAVSNTCGGTITGGAAGGTSIGLTGGALAASASCTLTVKVSAPAVGAYVNTTTAITTTNAGTTTTGTTASQTLNVTNPAPPFIAKAFSPAVVGINQPTLLTLTVTNPNTANVLDGLAFGDTYPAGLVNAATPAVANTCGGTVSGGSAGGASVGLSGGSLAAGASCTVTVNVSSASAGTYANTTGNVTSTTPGVGAGNSASATLTVAAKPTVAKAFSKTAMAVGDTATLTLTITNPNGSTALGNVSLSDTFPANLLVASPNALSNTCSGTVSAAPGAGAVSLSGGAVAIASSCTISVAVTSTVAGTYNNTSGGAASTESGSAGAASNTATLLVLLKPTIAKSFTPSTVLVGGTSTLSLVITNPNPVALSALAFTDTFPAGLSVAATPNASSACAGTFSAAAGAASIGLSGGSLAASQSCTLSVDVSSAAAGAYSNTSGGVASAETGAAGTASNTAVLTVNAPSGVQIEGFVYSDPNHNLQRDGGEAGTGLVLYAKLVAASAPAGPASQAVLVDPATGGYLFTGVASGAYVIVVNGNATLSDITPAIPATWTGTEAGDQVRRNVVVAAVDLRYLNFGLFNGNLVSGRVFRDNGSGGGTPNNALQDGTESGIGQTIVRLTNAAGGTTYDSTSTDAAGNYRLWLTAALSGSSLRVVEDNNAAYRSVGGAPAGSYDRNTDAFTFTYTAGSNTANLNFADVAIETLTGPQQRTAAPGEALFYAHTFTPGSGGSVAFNISSSLGWPQTLWRDTNCNGVLDAGEGVVSAPIAATAGTPVCVIVKVTVPTTAPVGAQNTSTLQAAFSYSNASPPLTTSLGNDDLTTVGAAGGAALALLKSQDNASPLPGGRIVYTITYTNQGSGAITSIRINDVTPAFTRFVGAVCVAPLAAGLSACSVTASPAAGTSGAIEFTLTGALLPSASGQVSFSVDVASGP